MIKTPQSLMLPADEMIQLKTKRLLAVTSLIEDYRKEHEDLQKTISDLTLTGKGGEYYFQKRWEEIRLRVKKNIDSYLFESKKPLVDLIDCEIRLRKSVGLQGSIFDWEILLPKEEGFGVHRQIVSLNHLRELPAAYEEERMFVRWLSCKGLIEIECKNYIGD
jgi:hypothetical protein